MLVSGEHGRLPDLALLQLSVAEQGVGAVRAAVNFGRQRHAAGRRDALAERAGAHIDAGQILHGRMPLQPGAKMAEGLQLFHREIPAICHRRIERRAGVSLGEHEPVPVRILRILRVDMHFLKEQERVDVRRGQRSARMPGFCIIHSVDDALSDLIRSFPEFQIVHCEILLQRMRRPRSATFPAACRSDICQLI